MNEIHRYENNFEFYKKMPQIITIIQCILIFIWSIVDVAAFTKTTYSKYSSETSYGIMQVPSPFLALIIWWLIGAGLALLNYLLTTLIIAPTVLQTQAAVEYLHRSQAASSANKNSSDFTSTEETHDSYCMHCGAKLANGDKTCPNCGMPLEPLDDTFIQE